MDVTDLARRLLRRRWAVVVVVLLAIVAAAGGVLTASSSQQSTASVVIVPPPLGDAVSDQNPLLNLDNNLAQLATVLAGALQSTDATDGLTERGASGSFTVSTVTGTNPSFAQLSPQLVFTVTATTAADARRTARALVAQSRAQLDDLQDQASVPTDARATIVQTVAPTTPTAAGSGGLRTGASYGLAVVVLGLLLVLLVDHLLVRRVTAPAAGPAPDEPIRTSTPEPEVPSEAPTKAAARRAPAETVAAKAPAKAPAKTATKPAAKTAAGKAAGSKYPAAKAAAGGSGRRRGRKSSGRSR